MFQKRDIRHQIETVVAEWQVIRTAADQVCRQASLSKPFARNDQGAKRYVCSEYDIESLIGDLLHRPRPTPDIQKCTSANLRDWEAPGAIFVCKRVANETLPEVHRRRRLRDVFPVEIH